MGYRSSGWRGRSSDDSLSLLLNASWVACGWNNVWNVGASNIIGDEVGDGRDRGGWDSEELTDINIVEETEEEALAAGLGLALSQAEGCDSCKGNCQTHIK